MSTRASGIMISVIIRDIALIHMCFIKCIAESCNRINATMLLSVEICLVVLLCNNAGKRRNIAAISALVIILVSVARYCYHVSACHRMGIATCAICTVRVAAQTTNHFHAVANRANQLILPVALRSRIQPHVIFVGMKPSCNCNTCDIFICDVYCSCRCGRTISHQNFVMMSAVALITIMIPIIVVYIPQAQYMSEFVCTKSVF